MADEQRAMEQGQRALEAHEKHMNELDARIKQLDAGLSAPGEQYKIEPLNAETVAVMQATVRKTLKDPDSAKFGTMVGGRTADGLLRVCGLVNAKNAFGAYTGMAPFTGIIIERPFGAPGKKPEGFVMTIFGDNERDRSIALNICREKGLALR